MESEAQSESEIPVQEIKAIKEKLWSLQDAAARRKALYNSRLKAISHKCESLYAKIGKGKFALDE